MSASWELLIPRPAEAGPSCGQDKLKGESSGMRRSEGTCQHACGINTTQRCFSHIPCRVDIRPPPTPLPIHIPIATVYV